MLQDECPTKRLFWRQFPFHTRQSLCYFQACKSNKTEKGLLFKKYNLMTLFSNLVMFIGRQSATVFPDFVKPIVEKFHYKLQPGLHLS